MRPSTVGLFAAVAILVGPSVAALTSPRPTPRPVEPAPIIRTAGSTFGTPTGQAVATPPSTAGVAIASTVPSDTALQSARPRRSLPPLPKPTSAMTGQYGLVVADLDTGEILEAVEADRRLVPASVAKLPTAVYALDRLGPEHRFSTRVLATGPIVNGVVEGDLVLVGGGEPALDSDDLAALATQVAGSVTGITGRFLVSHGGWPEIELIDEEQPIRAAYNPAIAGLNLNFNRVRLNWNRQGGKLDAGLDAHAAGGSPPAPSMLLTIEPKDCGCPPFAHSIEKDLEHWRVRGSMMGRRGAVWLPVREPDRYAAEVFRHLAATAGLTLPPADTVDTIDGTVIAEIWGKPLETQVRSMLRYSNNMSAEVLGLATSRAKDPTIDTLAASATALNAWSARLGGFDAQAADFALVNHSGLSADSRVTALSLVRFLVAVDRHPRLSPLLGAVLKKHQVEPPKGAGRAPSAIAKTGTMNFVRGLAGYLTTPSGRRLAFAWFANDTERRAASSKDRPRGARSWRNAAVHFERRLLTRWAGVFDQPPVENAGLR